MPKEIKNETSETQIIPLIFGAIIGLSIIGLLKSRKKLNETPLKANYMPPDVVFAPAYNGQGKIPDKVCITPPSSVYIQVSLGENSVAPGDQISISNTKYTYMRSGFLQPSVSLPDILFEPGKPTWHVYDKIVAGADWDNLSISGTGTVKHGPLEDPPYPFTLLIFDTSDPQ